LIGHPSPAGNESWNVPLIFAIGISEAVQEFPLLEDEQPASRRDDGHEEDVQPQVVDEESVGDDSNACAQVAGMTHHSIDPLPQQLALSLP
jgi:hypothetical protein